MEQGKEDENLQILDSGSSNKKANIRNPESSKNPVTWIPSGCRIKTSKCFAKLNRIFFELIISQKFLIIKFLNQKKYNSKFIQMMNGMVPLAANVARVDLGADFSFFCDSVNNKTENAIFTPTLPD